MKCSKQETSAMFAFSRRPRIVESTQALDQQEVKWWNTYAALIERIWGLPDPICRLARSGYIKEVGKRFHALLGAGPLRILEVACGAGWPGRLLASSSLKVTGMDFSEGQIQIARAKAAEVGQANCDYIQMDINQMNHSFQSNKYDGAFIHCGIHHLSTAELVAFSKGLAQSPKGFPIVLVEPVYLDQAKRWGRVPDKALRMFYSLLLRIYLSRMRQDEDVTRSTQALVELATTQGWFFSPKEAPFDRAEIESIFGPGFEVKEIVPVTRFALAAAQHLATLKDQDRATEVAKKVIPLLDVVDRVLITLRLLPAITRGYLFCRIVLIRK